MPDPNTSRSAISKRSDTNDLLENTFSAGCKAPMDCFRRRCPAIVGRALAAILTGVLTAPARLPLQTCFAVRDC